MFTFILSTAGALISILAILVALFALKNFKLITGGISFLVLLVSALGIIASGTIYVDDSMTGIINKKMGKDMPNGGIVALNGEKGPQVDILGPGYHFWYAPWNYDLILAPTKTIPQGSVGVVLALDGKAPLEGQVYAPEWKDPKEMLDGRQFLSSASGFRGPQSTILTPSTYRYNPRLFQIDVRPNTIIDVGEVGVVKSNFGPAYTAKDAEIINGTPLVPRGFRGIWKEVLQPGAYNIHPDAFTVIKFKTTQRVYTYQHNADPRFDDAILVRTKDAFQFPVEARISVSIPGTDAPYLVAMLGDPDKVTHDIQENEDLETLEARLIAPPVRAILRNTAEGLGALDFINTRSKIESDMSKQLDINFKQNKVRLEGVYIANIGLETTEQGKALLTTQTNQEVAKNEADMYEQQKNTQIKRSDFVKAQTDADQQKQLEAATYSVLVAKQDALAAVETAKGQANAAIEHARGEADALKLTYAARTTGYKNMEEPLGREGLVQLELLRLAADGHLSITPQVFVHGGGSASDALAGTILATQTKLLGQNTDSQVTPAKVP